MCSGATPYCNLHVPDYIGLTYVCACTCMCTINGKQMPLQHDSAWKFLGDDQTPDADGCVAACGRPVEQRHHRRHSNALSQLSSSLRPLPKSQTRARFPSPSTLLPLQRGRERRGSLAAARLDGRSTFPCAFFSLLPLPLQASLPVLASGPFLFLSFSRNPSATRSCFPETDRRGYGDICKQASDLSPDAVGGLPSLHATVNTALVLPIQRYRPQVSSNHPYGPHPRFQQSRCQDGRRDWKPSSRVRLDSASPQLCPVSSRWASAG